MLANCSPSTGYATNIPHHHFKVWLQYYCQVSLFQLGTRFQRPQCAAVMDNYGDHFLYCERRPHRIWPYDAQVKLLARDLAKAALHPFVEERSVGRHRERPDIRAFGRSGGTELFDDTICHPLSQARIWDVTENLLNLLKAAWTAILRHTTSGRNRVQPATCSVVNTRWLAPGRSEGVMLSSNYHCGKGAIHILPR